LIAKLKLSKKLMNSEKLLNYLEKAFYDINDYFLKSSISSLHFRSILYIKIVLTYYKMFELNINNLKFYKI
jgi:hypothetical protein